jgi:hypothetical protein
MFLRNVSTACSATRCIEYYGCGLVVKTSANQRYATLGIELDGWTFRATMADFKYIATIDNVREVSLLGSANLDYWQQRLARENLTPAGSHGQAEIHIVAANMTYKGINFTEVSFSVAVSGGLLLVQAFSSSRLFAFCERIFFATPYEYAPCRVTTSSPASITIEKSGVAIFQATMNGMSAEHVLMPGQSRCDTSDGWEGPIFLPTRHSTKPARGKLFYGRLRGHTEIIPFVAHRDAVSIAPQNQYGILAALADSHFAAKEWHIRPDATHARSKTYKRSAKSLDDAVSN